MAPGSSVWRCHAGEWRAVCYVFQTLGDRDPTPAHFGGADRGRAGSEGSVLISVWQGGVSVAVSALAQAPLQPFSLAAAVGASQEPVPKAAVLSGVSLPSCLFLVRAAQACRQAPAVSLQCQPSVSDPHTAKSHAQEKLPLISLHLKAL